MSEVQPGWNDAKVVIRGWPKYEVQPGWNDAKVVIRGWPKYIDVLLFTT